MNYKQETNNSNIEMGQKVDLDVVEGDAIEFKCTKSKIIRIIPFYRKRNNHPTEVFYKFQLLKNVPFTANNGLSINEFVLVNKDAFNLADKNEIDKLWTFLQETAALEKETVHTIVTTDNRFAAKEIVKTLKKNQEIYDVLESIDLDSLNSNVSLRNLKAIKTELESHLDDGQEVAYWHKQLKKYSWILSQLFIAPYILFEDEFYVGGKKYDRKGSIDTDFGMRNVKSKNCAIIEIKTPITNLIQQYRNENEIRISNELAGAISQILKQRDSLFKSYFTNHSNSEHEVVYEVNNIKSFLIIGKTPESYVDRAIFDNFRNELRNIEIITFDELLSKIQMQIDIIEKAKI